MYVIIEGIDGSGKDTQADLMMGHLGPQCLRVNEPDNTLPTGQLLRQMLRDGSYVPAHAAMFLADRIALLTEKVVPAINEGRNVISVRSWMSTLVYQQDNWPLDWLFDIHRLLPARATHLILLDIDPTEALNRASRRPGVDEYYERLDTQTRNRQRYRELMEVAGSFLAPCAKKTVIQGGGNHEEVHKEIMDWLALDG